MKITIALFLICLPLVSTSASAAKMIVKEVVADQNTAAIMSDEETILREGSRLFIKEEGNICDVEVKSIKMQGTILVVGIDECKDILVGQIAVTSLLDEYDFKESKRSNQEYPSRNEHWYTYWGVGGAHFDYNDPDLEKTLSDLESISSVERIPLSVDLFGFYWPFRIHTIIGFVVSSAADGYTETTTNSQFTIYQFTYSLSTMHFFGANIGSGFFLRGDAGLSLFSIDSTGPEGSYTAESEGGYGILAGGGYAWAFSKGTRMLFNTNYSIRKEKSEMYGTTSFSVGFLF